MLDFSPRHHGLEIDRGVGECSRGLLSVSEEAWMLPGYLPSLIPCLLEHKKRRWRERASAQRVDDSGHFSTIENDYLINLPLRSDGMT